MKNEIEFDLNRAVQDWREKLTQSPAFRAENLDELEVHLRDAVASMQTRGLSVEEAFLVAARRIGKDDLLEKEFAKLNRKNLWLDRILWMLIGIQVWGQVLSLSRVVTLSALAFGWMNAEYSLKQHGMVLPVTLFVLFQLAALAASVGICWWLIFRKGRVFGAWLEPRLQRRSTFMAFCGVLCALSLFLYSCSYTFSMAFGKFATPVAHGEFLTCSNWSMIAVLLIQTAAMSAFTLVLLRKRLLLKYA